MSFVIILATGAAVSVATGAVGAVTTVATSGYNLSNNVYDYFKSDKPVDEVELLKLEKKKEELEDQMNKLEDDIDEILAKNDDNNNINNDENINNDNNNNNHKAIVTYDNLRDGTIVGSAILFLTNPALFWQVTVSSSSYLAALVLALL